MERNKGEIRQVEMVKSSIWYDGKLPETYKPSTIAEQAEEKCSSCVHYDSNYCFKYGDVVGSLYWCHSWQDENQDDLSKSDKKFLTELKKYEDINFRPPQSVADAAKRGLELRAEFGRGGTSVGVARARTLSNRTRVSPSTINRMVSYFARHEVDLDAPAAKRGNEGFPSAGYIAWQLWGGFPGRSWANKIRRQMVREDEQD